MGVTCHAGEWPVNERFGTGSLDNLRAVLQPQAAEGLEGEGAVSAPLVSRVGHGIQVVLDPYLLNYMGGEGGKPVCFECCLTANVGWKVPSSDVHPVREMVGAGLRVALCCDNLLLSGSTDRAPSPSNEIVHFVRDVGMTYEDLAGHRAGEQCTSFFRLQGTAVWEQDKIGAWLRTFEHDVRTIIATNVST